MVAQAIQGSIRLMTMKGTMMFVKTSDTITKWYPDRGTESF